MSKDISKPTRLPDFSGLDLEFDIIDSHHHLFDLDAVYYPWLTDEPEAHFLLGNYDGIKRDYAPSDFRADTGDLRVVKTVHVEAEADHHNAIAETRWLSELMEHHDVPSAIVAHSWLHLPESESILAAQSEFKAVRGIRSKPVTSATLAERENVTGKAGSMQDQNWLNGLGLLRKYGFSWDLRVPYWHLVESAYVCGLYPDLPIVVEHTGLAWDRSEQGLAEWRLGMAALASHEHVYLKISELGLAGSPWDFEDNRKIVREAIELFGFNRCMFASNFPVAGLRIGYVDQVKAIATMISDCSATERSALFHDTAQAFYRLS